MAVFRLPANRNHYVYAMLCQDSNGQGYVKFGRSSSIGNRLTTLRTGCPIPVHYFAIIQTISAPKAASLERALHRHFADRRIRGEWFIFDFALSEDKQAFNQGCRDMFLLEFGGKERHWWTKISIAELDKCRKEQRGSFLNSKYKKDIKRRAYLEGKKRRAWKELERYGVA